MHRSFVSALLSLACLSTLPALAQAGSTQADVTLSVAANPTASGVSLTGTVQPPMPSTPAALPHPGGTLTFFDGGTALNTGGTALTAGVAYSSATFAQTFGTPDAVQANPLANWQDVAGDFNGDGTPDLLVCSTNAASNTLLLQVFASIPGGKFVVLPKQSFPFPQQIASPSLSVLDVDGDGHVDLLVGNMVAYGKGDGTFSSFASLPALATGFNQTYAADIDGDGKLDIVAVDTPPSTLTPGTVQYAFTVFHNDGGGTFTAMGPYPLAPSFASGCCDFYNIFGLSFADLNGDGRIDVLSQSNMVPTGTGEQSARLNVMLNLGTGFSAPKAIDTSTVFDESMVSISFADLNNDGKQDLVFSYQANTMNNGVATLLGKGDGTFAAPVDFTIGSTHSFGTSLLPLVAADMNGDGKIDVVLGSGV
ncbi:MAG TPA: VCBS repeat-containing protein, partial [Acidobacteriaceae bacterium]